MQHQNGPWSASSRRRLRFWDKLYLEELTAATGGIVLKQQRDGGLLFQKLGRKGIKMPELNVAEEHFCAFAL